MPKKDKNERKIDVVQIAKELYLSVDEKGNHAYSLTQISTKIEQEYKTKVARTTVRNWAKKYEWDKIFENGRKMGLSEKIKAEIDNGRQIDEAYMESIGKQNAEIYGTEKKIYDLSAELTIARLEYIAEQVRNDKSKAKMIDLKEVNAVSANAFKNLRLLTGESTENIDNKNTNTDLSYMSDEDLDKEIQKYEEIDEG